jgi:hypothetical protein
MRMLPSFTRGARKYPAFIGAAKDIDSADSRRGARRDCSSQATEIEPGASGVEDGNGREKIKPPFFKGGAGGKTERI